jgi:alpha-methylacyl-CoA racemase
MGPLQGLRIVEMSGIGPAPFGAMLLADLGAEVLRVDRLDRSELGFDIDRRYDFLNRNKRAIAVDLKAEGGLSLVKELIASADALIEGFRPGVMERLGLAPDICQALNPRLVFGRMTGWGQEGPLSRTAGHDINFIAVTGVLSAIGPKGGAPVPPLNLVGDFGGGGLYLALGVLAALHDARLSGFGQVVDAAMVDGTASLMTMHMGYLQAGFWRNERGENAVDGGSPYYTTYATSDGKYMAVGAVEKRFYEELIKRLGLTGEELPEQNDRQRWGDLRARVATVFATKTRSEWTDIFAGGDACVSPVLDMIECQSNPHVAARNTFLRRDGAVEPAPAPRFSRTPGTIERSPVDPRADTEGALAAWGITSEHVEALIAAGVIASR